MSDIVLSILLFAGISVLLLLVGIAVYFVIPEAIDPSSLQDAPDREDDLPDLSSTAT